MSTKPAVEAERPAVAVEDIRSARPYLLSRRSFVGLVRRLASIATLVILDLGGLTLGVYVALILRALYLGQWPPLWGLIWRTEADWLPFLTVITVLVFWVGGLYRRRELRAGVGQVIASLMLVAVITLAFAHEDGSAARTDDAQHVARHHVVARAEHPDEDDGQHERRRRQRVRREVVAGAKSEDQRDHRDERERRDHLADAAT